MRDNSQVPQDGMQGPDDPTIIDIGATDLGESGPASGPIFVTRVAIAPLRVDGVEASRIAAPRLREFSANAEIALREALAADSRVSQVLSKRHSLEIDNAITHAFFEERADASNLLDSYERYTALRLNDPIEFVVRIPTKNQPRYRNMPDVPSDEYHAYWDGITVYVQWRQERPFATGSGGHVVLDILLAVSAVAGFEARVVACAPGCVHRFLHADFATFPKRCAESDYAHSHGDVIVGAGVILPFDAKFDDPSSNLRETVRLLQPVCHSFAEASTRATEIDFLGARIQSDTEALLTVFYLRANRRTFPNIVGWLVDVWRLRGAGRFSRRLTAGIWLALATVESDLNSWKSSSQRLADQIQERNMSAIEGVFDVDAETIASINLSHAREAVAEISSRREGRMLVWATAAGAGAAVAGAAIAALLT